MSDAKSHLCLRPVLGFVDTVLLFVITGFNLIWVVRAAEAGAAGVTLWLLAGLLFYLPLGVCVVALARRFPGEGGLYVWSRESFGEFAGFITGWTYWACILPFLPTVLYFVAGTALYVGGGRWDNLKDSPTYFITMSLACLVVATWLNVVGLGVGKWLHNVGAWGAWLPAAVVMALGLVVWLRWGHAADVTPAAFVPRGGWQSLLLWSLLAFGLTGLEAIPVLGDEILDTWRMPRALALAAVLVIVTNVLATLAILAAPPPYHENNATAFMTAYESVAGRAGVTGLAPLIAGLVVVGYVGKVGAWTATGARLPFVAGVGRRLPPAFARLHPRWGTPYLALWLQAAIAAGLIVLGQAGTTTQGAFDVFQSMALIPTYIPFLFLFAAAFKLRRGVLPVVGFTATLAALAAALVPPATETNAGLFLAKVVGLAIVMLGVGAGVFLWGGRPSVVGSPAEKEET
jgi:amino acid transporter